MTRKLLTPLIWFVLAGVTCPNEGVAAEAMIPTDQMFTVKTTPIYNQDEVIKTVKDFVTIPVLFPTLIKGEEGKVYFASTDMQDNFKHSSPKEWYGITIGHTPGCFAHYCTLGYLSAELEGRLTADHALAHEGDKMTDVEVQRVPVDLVNNIKGYYTPGFAAGSYVEPKIQWYYKDILYTLQWATATQEELIQMANSALRAELGLQK